jgi:hypothetical protein
MEKRDLTDWEKLAITVALDVLYAKWSKDPESQGVAPRALTDLEDLKFEFGQAKIVTIS